MMNGHEMALEIIDMLAALSDRRSIFVRTAIEETKDIDELLTLSWMGIETALTFGDTAMEGYALGLRAACMLARGRWKLARIEFGRAETFVRLRGLKKPEGIMALGRAYASAGLGEAGALAAWQIALNAEISPAWTVKVERGGRITCTRVVGANG